MSAPSVEMRGVTKRFARALANDRVDFTAGAGEVHALVGENGAGKSTLMRILYGSMAPDAGEIRVLGHRGRFRNPSAAIAAGVGMVHQHFMLIGPMTVAENILLGEEPTRFGLLTPAAALEEIRTLSTGHYLDVDPTARIADLGVGEQQRVEILKVLFRGARVVILDEPTAVLAPQECSGLFRILRGLRDRGATVILITHRLEEVREVADRVTVMRGGRVIATHAVGDITARELAREMVGREVATIAPRDESPAGNEVLRLDEVCSLNDRGLPALDHVSLQLRAGQIVGVAGVEGNGQRELAEIAAGLRSITSGTVRVAGRDMGGARRRDFIDRGVSFIPEDRLDRGLVGDFTLADNLALGRHRRPPFRRGAALDPKAIADAARRLIASHDIRPPAPFAPARSFSGGNQQKAIVARELGDSPRLLIAAHPTRGVDVGAIEFIHERLLDARDRGSAVLLISAELPELLALSDRIVVLYRGRIVTEFKRGEASAELLGEWMLGGGGADA